LQQKSKIVTGEQPFNACIRKNIYINDAFPHLKNMKLKRGQNGSVMQSSDTDPFIPSSSQHNPRCCLSLGIQGDALNSYSSVRGSKHQ
jgi:hypothetical protein